MAYSHNVSLVLLCTVPIPYLATFCLLFYRVGYLICSYYMNFFSNGSLEGVYELAFFITYTLGAAATPRAMRACLSRDQYGIGSPLLPKAEALFLPHPLPDSCLKGLVCSDGCQLIAQAFALLTGLPDASPSRATSSTLSKL